MSERRWLSWVLAAVTGVGLLGCVDGEGGPPQGGQIGGVHGSEGGCDEEAEDIGADVVSPLGFSANEVIAALSGERSAPLTWAKGGSTTAAVSLGELVSARFVRSQVAEGGGPEGSGPGVAEPALAVNCADHLQIDVPLAFATEDGAFDESFSITLRAPQVDAGSYHHKIDLEALQGSYEVTEVDPAEFKEVIVYLRGTLSSSAVDGTISGVAESYPTESGPEGSVSATPFNVAEF
ncbi:hypothetical protein WMF37_20235 [Sorangium sp. So ce291]|uniref:hypothetical protein n=1 Tax=Sorangium sp. So ce291 TaxID=3133294 RepID=UPI003F5DB316